MCTENSDIEVSRFNYTGGNAAVIAAHNKVVKYLIWADLQLVIIWFTDILSVKKHKSVFFVCRAFVQLTQNKFNEVE